MSTIRSSLARARRRLLPPEILKGIGEGFRTTHLGQWKLDRRLRLIQESLGRIEARQTAAAEPGDFAAAEFRVFSQWGEDGIIQHLVRHVPVPERSFVEFGVEDYEEANTRFLMLHDNWRGLVLDGDGDRVQRIRESREFWLHDLTAAHAFVTRDNIDALLTKHGFNGNIGLLSIDIDGMDYWIWDAIQSVRPAIVVVEYNARLGRDRAVTVPYREDFDRRTAHHSLVYYGASLPALAKLGDRKGYDLVCCGSAGLNAFFVRKDLRPAAMPARTARDAFVMPRFCEYHDPEGRRVRLSNEQQAEMLRGLPLVEVEGDPAGTQPETAPNRSEVPA